jgi:hypothetical protein
MDLLHKSKEDAKVDAALRSPEMADRFDIDSNDIRFIHLLRVFLTGNNSIMSQGPPEISCFCGFALFSPRSTMTSRQRTRSCEKELGSLRNVWMFRHHASLKNDQLTFYSCYVHDIFYLRLEKFNQNKTRSDSMGHTILKPRTPVSPNNPTFYFLTQSRVRSTNLPPAELATKSQMQDDLHRHWLESAQKRLIESSSTRYLQNIKWVQEVHKFIKSKKKRNGTAARA